MTIINVLLTVKQTADDALEAHKTVLQKAAMPAGAWCAMRISRQGGEYNLFAMADTKCKQAITWASNAAAAMAA